VSLLVVTERVASRLPQESPYSTRSLMGNISLNSLFWDGVVPLKLDTSTWGLIIAFLGAALVFSSDYVGSMIPTFLGLIVGWVGISMIIRGRREEHEE